MRQYCLHNLSVDSQHPTQPHAHSALLCVLSRLEKLRPLVNHGLARIFYDQQIESRSLETSNRNILALVNSLEPDLRTRWFIATKNHTQLSPAPTRNIDVRDLPARRSVRNGDVPDDFVSSDEMWISFAGTAVFDSPQLEVSSPGSAPIPVENCADEITLTRNWPIYQPSPKHRLEEYERKGDVVSAMDLTVADANRALLIAVEHENTDRYAVVRGKVYRFLRTNPGSSPPVFHGFRVDERFIKPDVRRLLR